MLLRKIIPAIGLAAALLASGAAQAQNVSDKVLRVGNYGGRFTETQKKYVADLFTQNTGVRVEFIDGNPLDHIAKLVAARGRNVPYDVIYIDPDLQPTAISAGIIQPVDPEIVTNLKFLDDSSKSAAGYGPLGHINVFGIIYNKEKFAEAGIPAPTSWADLWDPRLAGRVAVGELAHGTGRALLVQAERLAGGDTNTPEKGIEKIAEIKAHSYYTSTVQLEALFPTGEVWASVIASGRGWGLIDKGYPLEFVFPKEGAVGSGATLEVVKGTPNPVEANEYINYALDPVSQIGQAWDIPYRPTNEIVMPVIAAYPELAKKLPGPLSETYQPDWVAYWANHEKAVDLWGRLITSK